jgi:hypothetical protein
VHETPQNPEWERLAIGCAYVPQGACRKALQPFFQFLACPKKTFMDRLEKEPQQGREAAAPSNIREIQEIQGGQEAPHNGDAISPKDA